MTGSNVTFIFDAVTSRYFSGADPTLEIQPGMLAPPLQQQSDLQQAEQQPQQPETRYVRSLPLEDLHRLNALTTEKSARGVVEANKGLQKGSKFQGGVDAVLPNQPKVKIALAVWEAAEMAWRIAHDQVFLGGNHRTATLAVYEILLRNEIILRRKPYELYGLLEYITHEASKHRLDHDGYVGKVAAFIKGHTEATT